MSPEPEQIRSSPASVNSAAPSAAPASSPLPFFGGKKKTEGPGRGGPGEPYTPMPDFSKPARPRWIYALAALLLALAGAAGFIWLRQERTAPAFQPAPITAPAVPGPQAGN